MKQRPIYLSGVPVGRYAGRGGYPSKRNKLRSHKARSVTTVLLCSLVPKTLGTPKEAT